MKSKILLVDDDRKVLTDYERAVSGNFEVATVSSGEFALRTIKNRGPIDVIVAAMQMPAMNGIQLLEQVRKQAPETVRILIVEGALESDTALQAIHQAAVFRVLIEPVSEEVLNTAIQEGIVQYQRTCAERDLQEKTRAGVVKVLADILSVSSPEAFARSLRASRIVRHITKELAPKTGWQWEAAATLSQLGCLNIECELVRKSSDRVPMTGEERERFESHPMIAMQMLKDIPQFEEVAWIISQQMNIAPPPPPAGPDPERTQEIARGAQVLRLALALDELYTSSMRHKDAIERLLLKQHFDHELVDTLNEYHAESGPLAPRWISTKRLLLGMVLEQDLRSHQGALLIPRGQEINIALRLKIENFAKSAVIDKEILVLTPTY